ncbi:MAG: hypothetical protein H6739_40850 [Alphaproteobacteria bacterium]|nr:hypothetical protein [Alphaproteobacteria bacterium]
MNLRESQPGTCSYLLTGYLVVAILLLTAVPGCHDPFREEDPSSAGVLPDDPVASHTTPEHAPTWRPLSIRMTNHGLVADVEISGPKGRKLVEMNVDTGSTYSYLLATDLLQVGITGQAWKLLLMQNAVGVVDQTLFMLPSIQIADAPPLGPAAVGVCKGCKHRILGDLVLRRLDLKIEWDRDELVSWSTNHHVDLLEDFRYFLKVGSEDNQPVAINLSGVHIHRATIQWCSEEFEPVVVLNLKPEERRRIPVEAPCPFLPSGYFSSVSVAPITQPQHGLPK